MVLRSSRLERHLEELRRVRPERFAKRHGSLLRVVGQVLTEFLRCGLLEHGEQPDYQHLETHSQERSRSSGLVLVEPFKRAAFGWEIV